MKAGPKIPYGGKATAIFGLVLIAIFWIGTSQRSSFELAEATASEFSKNENLALALDVQTEQLLAGIDHFLLLIKDQYEGGAAPRIPLKRLVAPAFGSASSITFIASPTSAATSSSPSMISRRVPTSSIASSSSSTSSRIPTGW